MDGYVVMALVFGLILFVVVTYYRIALESADNRNAEIDAIRDLSHRRFRLLDAIKYEVGNKESDIKLEKRISDILKGGV